MAQKSPAQKGLRGRNIFFADSDNLAISARNEHLVMSKKSFLVVENAKTKIFPNLTNIFLPSVFPCFLSFYISTFLTLVRPGGGANLPAGNFFLKISNFSLSEQIFGKIFLSTEGGQN